MSAMQMKPVAKRPESDARVPVKPAGKPIIAEPQVESFVYKSREAIAEQRALAASAVQQHLHKGVYLSYLLGWVALFSIFAIAFEDSPFTLFMILIGALNGVALFGVPIIMAPEKTSRLAFGDFLRGKFATKTGPVSGTEALIQVAMVPACLSLGALAIAYIMHVDYVSAMAELAEKLN